ncbi:MAG: 4Fe-4S dicluster domain-containing protein [Coriobacteriales bacterium]|nr:4Fe-4S dicluster domain-containing protein [Coriobacteriales bacterium]
MDTVRLSGAGEADQQAIAAIARDAGVSLDDCYQCGKCTAGCPMVAEMDLAPRMVIRSLQLGLHQKALTAHAPWVCAQCNVCSVRCPQNVDIAALMLAVRHAAKRAGLRPLREPDVFDDLFIAGIRSSGRSNEAILAARYNLQSGHLFQDVLNAPKMAAKGMIGPRLNRVKDRDAVRHLIDRCLGGEQQ